MRNTDEWEITDNFIKEGIHGICGQIEASGRLKQRIDSRIAEETYKHPQAAVERRLNMKRFGVKKIVIAVAIACLTLGTVCIASTGLKYSMSGMRLSPVYEEFADLGKAEAKAGIQIDAVEKFSSGYVFDNMDVSKVLYMNEANKKEGERKEIWINYRKGDENGIYFTAMQKYETGEPDHRVPDQTLQCGDVTAKFTRNEYKFVPPDYELTEEDEKNQLRDDYYISYGSEKIEYSINYSVSWEKEGIQYVLGGGDLSISPSEMLNMAKEIIESEQMTQ